MPTEVIVMKKWLYLLSGVVIGAVVATSSSAFAAQVKSLVGQKVTGEYTVVVNGKTLSDKGAVIDGRTNAPVRALSDALGADLKVEGKTINITTNESSNLPSGNNVGDSNTPKEIQKSALLNQKSLLEAEIDRLKKSKEYNQEQYEKTQESFPKQVFKQAVDEIDKQLSEKNQELEKLNDQLAALEK